MAGLYPDVLDFRMPYDRDGTAGFTAQSGIVTSLTGTQMAHLNSEDIDSNALQLSAGVRYYGFLFPELRDITGYFISENNQSSGLPDGMEWSANTTSGLDGTWTTEVPTQVSVPHGTAEDMRNEIEAVTITGAKGVRFKYVTGFNPANDDTNIYLIHLYGSYSSGENPDRLRFWQPVTNAEIGPAYFDLGDVTRGSADVVQFRIKNNSATLTAESIEISAEALTDTSPTNVGQHNFSDDGASYSPTVNIGDLAPGAISIVLYVRRDTNASADLSLWWTRFVATAALWT